MKTFKSIPLILLSILLVGFFVANRQWVPINLWPLFPETEVRLFVVFFGGIFFGLVLAWLIMAYRGIRHYSKMKSADKEATRLSKEVEGLEGELDKKPPKVEQKDYTESSPGQTRKLAKRDQAD